MRIHKTYIDDKWRIHDLVLDEETGETLSDTIRTEPDPDEAREKELEDK